MLAALPASHKENKNTRMPHRLLSLVRNVAKLTRADTIVDGCTYAHDIITRHCDDVNGASNYGLTLPISGRTCTAQLVMSCASSCQLQTNYFDDKCYLFTGNYNSSIVICAQINSVWYEIVYKVTSVAYETWFSCFGTRKYISKCIINIFARATTSCVYLVFKKNTKYTMFGQFLLDNYYT